MGTYRSIRIGGGGWLKGPWWRIGWRWVGSKLGGRCRIFEVLGSFSLCQIWYLVMSHLHGLEPRSSIKADGHRGKIGMSFVRKAGDPPDRGVMSEILCSGFQ